MYREFDMVIEMWVRAKNPSKSHEIFSIDFHNNYGALYCTLMFTSTSFYSNNWIYNNYYHATPTVFEDSGWVHLVFTIIPSGAR